MAGRCWWVEPVRNMFAACRANTSFYRIHVQTFSVDGKGAAENMNWLLKCNAHAEQVARHGHFGVAYVG